MAFGDELMGPFQFSIAQKMCVASRPNESQFRILISICKLKN